MTTPVTNATNLLDNWAFLTPEERGHTFQVLPRDEADDLFLNLATHDQAELLLSLPEGEQRLWIRLLPPDDAADLIQRTDAAQQAWLLSQLDETTRAEVKALLAYAEDAAGGLMNPRFARLRPEMLVDEAIAYLRKQGRAVETIYYAYVLDGDQRLLGVVSFRDLFSADRNKSVQDVMRTDIITATEEMDQESVAKLFAEHHVLALPVVDVAQRMKGIVTVDDIVDVVQEEASEDIQKIGGSAALDAPYLNIDMTTLIRKRAGWLAVLFVGELFTATAMAYFEDEIARAVVLALFVPLIISSGGNSGSQASTLVIRAMAIGEVRLRDWWRVIRRELIAGVALGMVLAVIGATRILLWQSFKPLYGPHYLLIALTIALSLIGVVLFGTISGSMLPFVLRGLGFDPASASAPFVATLVDVTGLVIYFTVASLTLRGTLL